VDLADVVLRAGDRFVADAPGLASRVLLGLLGVLAGFTLDRRRARLGGLDVA